MTRREHLIRDALSAEAPGISKLAQRSKALWPYSDEFLAACKDELTYRAAQIDDPQMVFRVVDEAGVISAFMALGFCSEGEGELLALFVDPACVRRGLGEVLWHEAVRIAARRGVRALLIASDPYAEPFYARMGARKCGEIASQSIPGRVLPLMRFEVAGLASNSR